VGKPPGLRNEEIGAGQSNQPDDAENNQPHESRPPAPLKLNRLPRSSKPMKSAPKSMRSSVNERSVSQLDVIFANEFERGSGLL
jgi:hypothetical protein